MHSCSPIKMHSCNPGKMHSCIPGKMYLCFSGKMHSCIPGKMHLCFSGKLHLCIAGNMHICIPGKMHLCMSDNKFKNIIKCIKYEQKMGFARGSNPGSGGKSPARNHSATFPCSTCDRARCHPLSRSSFNASVNASYDCA